MNLRPTSCLATRHMTDGEKTLGPDEAGRGQGGEAEAHRLSWMWASQARVGPQRSMAYGAGRHTAGMTRGRGKAWGRHLSASRMHLEARAGAPPPRRREDPKRVPSVWPLIYAASVAVTSLWMSSEAVAATSVEVIAPLALRPEDAERYGSLVLLFGLTILITIFARWRAGAAGRGGKGGGPGAPGGTPPPPPGNFIEEFERVRLRGRKGPTKEQLARSPYLRAEYELRRREAEARKAEHEREIVNDPAGGQEESAEDKALEALTELLDEVDRIRASSEGKEKSK